VSREQWTAVLLAVVSSEQWTAVLLVVVSSEQWTAVLLAKHAKISEFWGDPRLNFSLENVFCAILIEMVLFDAVLHSKHKYQVASAISILVFELFKFSVEVGMKIYAHGKMMRELFVKRIPSYFSESG